LLYSCLCVMWNGLPTVVKEMHLSFESLAIIDTLGLHFSLMDIHHDTSLRSILEDDSISSTSKVCIHSYLNNGARLWLIARPSMCSIVTPLLEECEDDIHTLEMGTWESSETLETSEFDGRGQNTLSWSVPYIIRKLSKRRCRKWPHMSHLDICSTSYDKKKGRESNW